MQQVVHSVFITVVSVVATLLTVGLTGVIILLATDGIRPTPIARTSGAIQCKPHVQVNRRPRPAVLRAGRERPLPRRLDGRVVETVAVSSDCVTDHVVHRPVRADDGRQLDVALNLWPASPPACTAA